MIFGKVWAWRNISVPLKSDMYSKGLFRLGQDECWRQCGQKMTCCLGLPLSFSILAKDC